MLNRKNLVAIALTAAGLGALVLTDEPRPPIPASISESCMETAKLWGAPGYTRCVNLLMREAAGVPD
jgi:hypothetical protein